MITLNHVTSGIGPPLNGILILYGSPTLALTSFNKESSNTLGAAENIINFLLADFDNVSYYRHHHHHLITSYHIKCHHHHLMTSYHVIAIIIIKISSRYFHTYLKRFKKTYIDTTNYTHSNRELLNCFVTQCFD